MIENVRIAILSTGNAPLAYMDNKHKKSMHYWKDELHEYLQGAANTYTFTVNAKHTDAQHITVGNKVAFKYKGKSYYLNITETIANVIKNLIITEINMSNILNAIIPNK